MTAWDKAVRAGGGDPVAVFAHRIGGEGDDRHVGLGVAARPDRADDVEAGQPRHLDIDDHEIGREGVEPFERLDAVAADLTSAFQGAQHGRRDHLIGRVVLGQEDPQTGEVRAAATRSPAPPRRQSKPGTAACFEAALAPGHIDAPAMRFGQRSHHHLAEAPPLLGGPPRRFGRGSAAITRHLEHDLVRLGGRRHGDRPAGGEARARCGPRFPRHARQRPGVEPDVRGQARIHLHPERPCRQCSPRRKAAAQMRHKAIEVGLGGSLAGTFPEGQRDQILQQSRRCGNAVDLKPQSQRERRRLRCLPDHRPAPASAPRRS